LRTSLYGAILILFLPLVQGGQGAGGPRPEIMTPAPRSARTAGKTSVLMLNSYHEGHAWRDELFRSARELFAVQPEEIDLWVENMDTRRQSAAQAAPAMLQWLAGKYAGRRFDVILSTDDDALEFLIRHRAALFPASPVVFCGINGQDRIRRAPREWFTGLIEIPRVHQMLERILPLHPKARRLVAVNDNSATGLAGREQIKAVAGERKHLAFELLDGSKLTFEEILARLASLPSGSVVLTTQFSHDRTGRHIPDGLARLAQSSAAPAYSPDESRLGQGLVGGSANMGYEHGRRAALIALRVVRGARPAEIPVAGHGEEQMVFDAAQLDRWGIRESSLRPGSVVVNRAVPAPRDSLRLIFGGGFFIAFLLLAIVSLAFNSLRRRKVEARLRQSQENLALAQQIARLGSWTRDLSTQTMEWSEEVHRIFGTDPANFKPTLEAMIDLIHPEDRERVLRFIRRADAEGVDRDLEYRIVRPDGAVRSVSVNARLARKPWNRTIATGTLQDVTETREAEEQLRQAQKMETVGQLAGGIAHDFNNLLTVILGHAQLSLKRCRPGDPLRSPIEEIVRAAERAADLTRQLLAFGRRQVFEPRVLDLNEVVRSIDSMLRPLAGEGVEVRVRLAGGPVPVEADSLQLERVLVNLATNARDAMPAGGVIEVETSELNLERPRPSPEGQIPPGLYAQLVFRDNGRGMDEATRKRIFEPFFTTKAPGKGTGLGLSTVYGIVRQSGGHITASSRPGEGTEFRILLPAAAAVSPTQ
jgi:PAS domain S-box-containing protein